MKKFHVRLAVDEESKAFIKEFDELFGCKAACKKELKDGETAVVDFEIDRHAISRGAGRPKKDLKIDKTVAEVYAYQANRTQKETAAWLGISLRTYQRYLASLKYWGLWGPDDREPFAMQLKPMP